MASHGRRIQLASTKELMSTGERHGARIRDGRLSSLDRCMTTHLLSFVLQHMKHLRILRERKSRFDIAGLVESAPVYL
jgi:hypothetical protein